MGAGPKAQVTISPPKNIEEVMVGSSTPVTFVFKSEADKATALQNDGKIIIYRRYSSNPEVVANYTGGDSVSFDFGEGEFVYWVDAVYVGGLTVFVGENLVPPRPLALTPGRYTIAANEITEIR